MQSVWVRKQWHLAVIYILRDSWFCIRATQLKCSCIFWLFESLFIPFTKSKKNCCKTRLIRRSNNKKIHLISRICFNLKNSKHWFWHIFGGRIPGATQSNSSCDRLPPSAGQIYCTSFVFTTVDHLCGSAGGSSSHRSAVKKKKNCADLINPVFICLSESNVFCCW